MRRDLVTIAALAAGGLVLADQMRRRREPHHFFERMHAHEHVHADVPLGSLLVVAGGLAAGGLLLSKYMANGRSEHHDSTVHESIELNVPVRTAYNQWTQFEEFPRFMASVEEVRQINDTHLHWRAKVGGKTKEWEAEITEQIPDKRIAWRSTGGVRNAGVVTFHRIDDNRTRVMLQMDYAPDTVHERVADAVGAVKLTTKGNLKRFKELVESRGTETGAWRGTVQEH